MVQTVRHQVPDLYFNINDVFGCVDYRAKYVKQDPPLGATHIRMPPLIHRRSREELDNYAFAVNKRSDVEPRLNASWRYQKALEKLYKQLGLAWTSCNDPHQQRQLSWLRSQIVKDIRYILYHPSLDPIRRIASWNLFLSKDKPVNLSFPSNFNWLSQRAKDNILLAV